MTNKPHKSDTVKKRILEKQEDFLTAYKKTWTITGACLKIEIDRATYYDWIAKYPKFKKRVNELDEAHNDYTETQLIKAIKESNLTAIIFYLKNKHQDYRNKLKLEGELGVKRELTKEQKVLLKEAIKHAFGRKKN